MESVSLVITYPFWLQATHTMMLNVVCVLGMIMVTLNSLT